MRLIVAAVGRLKAGLERELADRYLDRAAKSGRAIGITKVDTRELNESRAARPDDRKAEEAAELLALLPDSALLIALDERGRSISSPDFAAFVGQRRDAGVADIVLVIGGPDGLADAVRERAGLVIAFGAMTWPHQLVRVMLAEQIYRAITILSGHPYHRV